MVQTITLWFEAVAIFALPFLAIFAAILVNYYLTKDKES